MNEVGYIPDELYARIQSLIPIVTVDLLLFRRRDSAGVRPVLEAGLIQRWYPDSKHPEKLVWCVVGGRLHRGESVDAGLRRQAYETLGPALAQLNLPDSGSRAPDRVVEYLPDPTRSDGPFDPRQHSIGLQFFIEVDGSFEPKVRGDAVAFDWWSHERVSKTAEIGFGLKEPLLRWLEKLASQPSR